MEHLIASVFLILSPFATLLPMGSNLAPNLPPLITSDYITGSILVETKTSFRTEEISIEKPLPFPTEYEDDPEVEWGKERIIQEGVVGGETLTYKVTYWYGEEQERALVNTERKDPQPQIVARGTKKIYREEAAEKCGTFTYFGKLRVWATSYDASCPGCSKTTATGMKAGFGVIAVDPKIIPLHTKVCIPGYGIATAADTGGAVKGLKIDLGFDNLQEGWWSSRWTEIFLLD